MRVVIVADRAALLTLGGDPLGRSVRPMLYERASPFVAFLAAWALFLCASALESQPGSSAGVSNLCAVADSCSCCPPSTVSPARRLPLVLSFPRFRA